MRGNCSRKIVTKICKAKWIRHRTLQDTEDNWGKCRRVVTVNPQYVEVIKTEKKILYKRSFEERKVSITHYENLSPLLFYCTFA